MNIKAAEIKDIGFDVVPPTLECNDPNCPFHGSLSVRGQTIDGVVATVKMNKTVVVERNYISDKSRYMLWVQQQNHTAVAMYKKKGFTNLGKSTLSLIKTMKH